MSEKIVSSQFKVSAAQVEQIQRRIESIATEYNVAIGAVLFENHDSALVVREILGNSGEPTKLVDEAIRLLVRVRMEENRRRPKSGIILPMRQRIKG